MKTKLFIALMITVVSFETQAQSVKSNSHIQELLANAILQNEQIEGATKNWTSRVSYGWDLSGAKEQWDIRMDISRYFDENDLLKTDILKNWNAYEKKWDDPFKTEWSYSTTAKVKEGSYFETTKSGGWLKYAKSLYTYTGFDSISTIDNYAINGNNSNIMGKSSYEYDSYNYVNKETIMAWDYNNSKLYLKYKINKKNNSKGLVLSAEEISCWMAGKCNTYRISNTYNTSDQLYRSVYEELDSSRWVMDSRSTYSYNADNQLSSILIERNKNGSWIPNNRLTYSYNNDKLLSTIKEGFYNSGKWDVNSKRTFSYNNTGNLIEELLLNRISGTSGSFENKNKIVYGYEDVKLELKTQKDNYEINIYPNPTTGILNLSFNKLSNQIVEILNLNGEKVYYESVDIVDAKIDLSHLDAGIYFLKTSDGENMIIRKIIKQ